MGRIKDTFLNDVNDTETNILNPDLINSVKNVQNWINEMGRKGKASYIVTSKENAEKLDTRFHKTDTFLNDINDGEIPKRKSPNKRYYHEKDIRRFLEELVGKIEEDENYGEL